MRDPEPGTFYLDLDTPALLLDLDAFEHNVGLMAQFFADRPTSLGAGGRELDPSPRGRLARLLETEPDQVGDRRTWISRPGPLRRLAPTEAVRRQRTSGEAGGECDESCERPGHV